MQQLLNYLLKKSLVCISHRVAEQKMIQMKRMMNTKKRKLQMAFLKDPNLKKKKQLKTNEVQRNHLQRRNQLGRQKRRKLELQKNLVRSSFLIDPKMRFLRIRKTITMNLKRILKRIQLKIKEVIKNTSAKKESAGKAKAKRVATSKKSRPPTKGTPVRPSSNRSKVDDGSDASPKTFSRKKRTPVKSSSNRSKVEDEIGTSLKKKRTPAKSSSNRSKVDEIDASPKTFSRKKKTESVKEKSSTPKKPVCKEKTGEKTAKGKEKSKEAKLRPSEDELRDAIREILTEVDFNTATFTDILKQLAGRYEMDLAPRKSWIVLMIKDELTKQAYEAVDEEDKGDGEKDETQLPSGKRVKCEGVTVKGET